MAMARPASFSSTYHNTRPHSGYLALALANPRPQPYPSCMTAPDLNEDYVASPCVSVCTMDKASGMCIGCLRTLAEIGAWRTMTLAEKRATVAACAERAKAIPPRGKDWQPL
jgi:predicted Fe-S protein YdhL (DUF1289 family)